MSEFPDFNADIPAAQWPIQSPLPFRPALNYDQPWPQNSRPGIGYSTVPLPFNTKAAPGAGATLDVTVTPGYIAGFTPTIGGDPITDDPPPELSIADSGTQIIYLELSVTLTAVNDFVYKSVFSSAVINVAGSLPADDLDAGLYYLRLATYEDGAKQVPQPVLTNLTYYIADTLDGTSSANCHFAAL